MKVFSIFDSKAEAYMIPFFMATRGLAIRGVQDCMKDSNHNFSKYPADFTLMEIGEWDEDSGVIARLETKVNCGTLVELKGESIN